MHVKHATPLHSSTWRLWFLIISLTPDHSWFFYHFYTFHLHVAYVFAKLYEDLYHMNLLLLIGLVKALVRFFLVHVNLLEIHTLIFHYFTNKMILNIYIFYSWMKRWIPCKALWQSQYKKIFSCLCLSSSINFLSYITSLQVWVAALYLAFVVDKATIVCSIET